QRRLSKAARETGRRTMSQSWESPRRTVLRGLGTAFALPLLDAMLPTLSSAARAAGAPAAPLRMAFVYVPHGKHMQDWTPAGDGDSFELPSTLEPLSRWKSEFCVVSGSAQQQRDANGEGGGDHARA